LLDLTHDSIFVRDMSDVITYWNRGAQELYRWTAEEAIGKRSREILRTIFPVPIEDISAEVLLAGRWEGELKRTKADGTEMAVASRWSLRRDERDQPVAIMETSLLDLKLPKVDGLEVLQQIKSDEKLRIIPVVVLTSSREERDMVASYKLGVNAYVVKPVDFHEFVNAIKELGIFWAIINEAPPGSVRK
jgi:PAS domain S-box-containing protein